MPISEKNIFNDFVKKIPIIYHPNFLLHLTGPRHPEAPARCESIVDALKRQGLLENENLFLPLPASLEQIALCHKKSYTDLLMREISLVKEMQAITGEYTLSCGDVQICPESMDVALLACGAVLKAVELVMEGAQNRAFVIVRPPGHHATSSSGMGFCLFNNVAVAARFALQKYPLKRILIVDWDVHHGNGTQDIFYNDAQVFYFSTHQSGIYPGTGSEEEKGCGNILNCPIAGGPGSRQLVLKAFHEKLTGAMKSFQPELIFISAGFDGHYADPLGGFDLTADDFYELTEVVCQIANQYSGGRIVSVLEGGYNLNALAESAVSHVKALS